MTSGLVCERRLGAWVEGLEELRPEGTAPPRTFRSTGGRMPCVFRSPMAAGRSRRLTGHVDTTKEVW